MIGITLSHYRIVSKLGEGGMGEVYRAHDEKLGRDVAIKVLPEAVAQDPDRLARFEREAKAIAKLSHPNILEIHELGEHEGRPFIVTEILEGETLRDRLEGDALGWRRATEIGASIADGLAAAHAAGIVHRDLKPSNVFLTSDGRVKILDFGLARHDAGAVGKDETHAPTVTRQTEPGTVLGTVGYMSPEQVSGSEADHRSDIFSLGCVLYEMASGRRAFAGDTAVETMNAILKDEPPEISGTDSPLPSELERNLRRCLEKRPGSRFQSASDLAYNLRSVSISSAPSVAPPRSRPITSKRHLALLWIGSLAVIAIVAAILGGVLLPSVLGTAEVGPGSDEPVVRAVLSLDPNERLAPVLAQKGGVGYPIIALSPDGSSLAFVVKHEDSTRIHLRRLGETPSMPLAGTEGGYCPFFSPDGEWIGFFADNTLKKVAIRGGAPVVLCDVGPSALGGSWGEDGKIVVSTDVGVNLKRVSDRGGDAELLLSTGSEQGFFLWPQVIQSGRAILVTVANYYSSPDYWTLAAFLPATGKLRTLVEGGFFARALPSGYLMFIRGSTLYALPFDEDSVEVSGDAVPTVDGIRTEVRGAAQFSYARSGSLAYVPGSSGRMSDLVWVDTAGNSKPLGFPPQNFSDPRLSPDGRQLAVQIAGAKAEIWVYDLEHGSRRRLAGDGNSSFPVWTPDGREIWFVSDRDGANALYRAPADGSAVAQRVTVEADIQPWAPNCWSPDGQTLVFMAYPNIDLMLYDVKSGQVRPFVATETLDWGGVVSPNGKWIAYVSEASGDFSIEVKSFPDGDRTWTIATPGVEPKWSPDGDSLFYKTPSSWWMAVDCTIEPDFTHATPRRLFRFPNVDAAIAEWDVGPKGHRFLIARDLDYASEPPMPHLIINFDTELKRLVPTE